MIPFCCIVLTIIISISPCQIDAAERAALSSMRGQSIPITETEPLNIPSWAVNIPEHSYVGISTPSPSIEAARQQAIDSAISQILQTMGADYQLTHESVLSGNLNQSRYELKERLSYTARWLLNSVQQNIKQYAFQKTGNGHVCFVLVRMRSSDLEKLKRLTIGAKLTATMVEKNGEYISIKVNELNDVGVSLTEYRIATVTAHSNARLITLFFWKVPESDHGVYEGALPHRLFLKNSSGRATIRISDEKTDVKSFIMGSKQDLSITLTGFDEIGRPVSVPVRLR